MTGSDRAGRPTVEVAHEALIRTWPRLREWINANREKLRARAAVLQAKAEWEQQGRREDLLLPSGFQLERARSLINESWRHRHPRSRGVCFPFIGARAKGAKGKGGNPRS